MEKKPRNSFTEFETLHHFFRVNAAENSPSSYWVPEILIGGASHRKLVDVGNPYRFYVKIFNTITTTSKDAETFKKKGEMPQKLSIEDCIYQSYIRTFASLNGEIGTALKQIAFLPFLRERLGITIFISLPTGVIGQTNKKGQRGSPFAIKNPFDIDESLGDPLLPEFSALFQYKALMQACQKLDIRAGSIVPLTTLSIDSPLFKIFPDLGFWWEAEPEEMLFCEPNVQNNSENIANEDSYIPPQISIEAKRRFVSPPPPGAIETYFHNGQKYYIATVQRDGHNASITLANSFPDVMGGSIETYTWNDVSSVNYTSKHYPLPMGIYHQDGYDTSKSAWCVMPHVIAWRIRELGEEIFLIDVNASVPEEILTRAQQLAHHWKGDYPHIIEKMFRDDIDVETSNEVLRLLDPTSNNTDTTDRFCDPLNVSFIAEELWSFDHHSDIVKAIVGPLIFCVSAHTHNHITFLTSLCHHLKMIENREETNLFFVGVSNHDTMPPLPDISPLLYVIYSLLPGSLPFIFSGTEFYAQAIINREFGFNTSEELLKRREQLTDDIIGLFNDCPLDWTSLPEYNHNGHPVVNMCHLLYRLIHLRRALITPDLSGYCFLQLPPDNRQKENCFGYMRYMKNAKNDAIIVYVNFDLAHSCLFSWTHPDAELIFSVSSQSLPSNIDCGDMLNMPPSSAAIFAIGKFKQQSQPMIFLE